MSLASDIKDDIAILLDDADYGRDVTLTKTSAGSYNSTTGAVTGQSDTSINTRAIVLGYVDMVIDGTLQKRYARKVILKVKDMAQPAEVNDRLTVGSDTYTVLEIKKGELGGETYLQTLMVR